MDIAENMHSASHLKALVKYDDKYDVKNWNTHPELHGFYSETIELQARASVNTLGRDVVEKLAFAPFIRNDMG